MRFQDVPFHVFLLCTWRNTFLKNIHKIKPVPRILNQRKLLSYTSFFIIFKRFDNLDQEKKITNYDFFFIFYLFYFDQQQKMKEKIVFPIRQRFQDVLFSRIPTYVEEFTQKYIS